MARCSQGTGGFQQQAGLLSQSMAAQRAGSAERGGSLGRCPGACEEKLKTPPGSRRHPQGEA